MLQYLVVSKFFLYLNQSNELNLIDMTLTQATNKAKKVNVTIEETKNGHFYFISNTTGKKGSAWLEDGVFTLPSKIYSEEEDSAAADMKDLFRYLTR